MLYNRSLLGWLLIFSLSTLLKLNFFLLDLNNNSVKYRTALSLQPTPLATLVLFSTNTLPSRIKSLHFLSLANNHIRELRCIRPYLSFKTASTIATSIVHSKLDYSTVTLSIITFQTVNLTGSNRLKTLLLVLLLRLLNPLISLPFSNLSTG